MPVVCFRSFSSGLGNQEATAVFPPTSLNLHSNGGPGPRRLAFDVLCWLLDAVYEGRPIQRFWVLETVARIPYFRCAALTPNPNLKKRSRASQELPHC